MILNAVVDQANTQNGIGARQIKAGSRYDTPRPRPTALVNGPPNKNRPLRRDHCI
ncbi:MAG: hypothetical protein ACI853_000664, partial [Paracoccaceae bacterium]